MDWRTKKAVLASSEVEEGRCRDGVGGAADDRVLERGSHTCREERDQGQGGRTVGRDAKRTGEVLAVFCYDEAMQIAAQPSPIPSPATKLTSRLSTRPY